VGYTIKQTRIRLKYCPHLPTGKPYVVAADVGDGTTKYQRNGKIVVDAEANPGMIPTAVVTDGPRVTSIIL